jgi:hypothetical protein
MLHKRESKSKGESVTFEANVCSKEKEGSNDLAFLIMSAELKRSSQPSCE